MRATAELEQYLAEWMDARGVTKAQLSRKAGHTRNYVGNLFQGKHFSIIPFVELDSIVKFPPEMLAKAKAGRKQFDHDKAMRGGETLRTKTDQSTRKPWPRTVSEMKASPPIYARAWA